jgi:hypothetical protein
MEELRDVTYEEHCNEQYELVIPAAHSDVGDLRVLDDGEELTLSLGAHHHWHVALYRYADEPPGDRVRLTADDAVESIRSVLEHRTILRLTLRDGRVISSSTYQIDYAGVRPATADEIEYCWRGPRVRLL